MHELGGEQAARLLPVQLSRLARAHERDLALVCDERLCDRLWVRRLDRAQLTCEETAHSAETDFGALKVMSMPATRVPLPPTRGAARGRRAGRGRASTRRGRRAAPVARVRGRAARAGRRAVPAAWRERRGLALACGVVVAAVGGRGHVVGVTLRSAPLILCVVCMRTNGARRGRLKRGGNPRKLRGSQRS